MTDCWCDWEPAGVYAASIHTARVAHKCYECRRTIEAGQRYERVAMLFEGRWSTYKTCGRCVSMRAWVQAHVPCLCFTHGNTVDECFEAAREYAHEAPGLLFGAWRRYISPKFCSLRVD